MKSLQKYGNSCIVFFFFVGVFSLRVSSVLGDDYLKEAPSFLIPCHLNDPNNGDCLAKAVENVFTNWREGVPGLKSVGSVDPFHVKKVHLEQNNPNINIKMDLKNAIITGLSKSTVTKASINNDYTFKFLVKIPSINIKSDYRMKGSILFLRLDGTGLMELKISEADIIFVLKTKLISAHGQKFFDIQSIDTDIKNVGKFQVHFGNLFNGNTELEQSANDVFNQNWQDLMEIMRPVLQETLSAISIDRYKRIFNYVPAKYFIEDLE